MLRIGGLSGLLGMVALICAGVACDGDEGGGGTTTSTSSTSGTGGTGGGGGGEGCLGDPQAWNGIQKENISCTKNSDCCLVINGCLGEGQVVHASDYQLAQQVWPYCPDDGCVQCLPPFVEVACVDGSCVGEATDWNGEPNMEESHCGVDDEPVSVAQPATAFSC